MGSRSWSPDGLRLLTFSDDGTIRIWSMDGTGEPIVLRDMLESTGGTFNSAAWSPDGRRIVAAADNRTVWVWDDFEPPRGPDDPRIWAATRYCPSIEERQRLLDVTEEMAHRDVARCEERVWYTGHDGGRPPMPPGPAGAAQGAGAPPSP
jgi:hypothetical protein